ncbi:MAG: bifunctional (p)ppGpp synthetase/guanosine-3',5'-bis(diphosphate) 3'-pyrophosphohydrolase [Bacteroidaceae bacterium]|nr:bifunctional (p)ppGpp synthetase/guanosine-3',5'-bis(diphosphate) 3'-pyrophosphohydrolase [Bacteroidaceae bacterium]
MTNDEMINKAVEELKMYLPTRLRKAERKLIENAFTLARDAHASQTRKSGEPYILHPLAVALIVVREMRQTDAAVIAAALLHDVVEDTDVTIEQIRTGFGDDVAFLVDAVTKPNKDQVDNFQHILASVNGDVRVLILKISDRLHNIRTLEGLPPKKQWKIASETQFFFAPLAGRLGLYKVKSELENLAFKFLNPNEYQYIENALEEDKARTKVATESFMHDAGSTVRIALGTDIGWDIRYRKPYSIWREMQELGCDFYHVPFKHYIRAVFDPAEVYFESDFGMIAEEDLAMKIYTILAGTYHEQSGSFTNFMTQPKANGYRSLHVRFLNPFGGIEEFHISSEKMREQSYLGCVFDSKEEWLKRLTDVLKELAKDPDEMMIGIHASLYNEDVVVYTPKNKPVTLPKGATVLDFAYAVHSEIGDHAKYARINGRLASIKTELKRGDCVEVGTDSNIYPSTDWLSSVVSYKAKKHINNYLRKLAKPKYDLCPHCNPMPGSEIIGFKDPDGKITLHSRNCADAIRTASEKGNTIVAVDDFKASADMLYPVKIDITGIDRYHLLKEIITCIVDNHKLSMNSLCTETTDNIVHCSIDFSVHSANELREVTDAISSIEGVEEVKSL